MMPQNILNLCSSDVLELTIAHKTASNEPLWKAWPQTIVTAASLKSATMESMATDHFH